MTPNVNKEISFHLNDLLVFDAFEDYLEEFFFSFFAKRIEVEKN